MAVINTSPVMNLDLQYELGPTELLNLDLKLRKIFKWMNSVLLNL